MLCLLGAEANINMLVVYDVQKKTQFFSSYYFTSYNAPLNGEIFAILVKELR